MSKKALGFYVLIIIILFLGISRLMKTEIVVSFIQNKPLGLKESIEKITSESKSTYGIYIKNLKTGQAYSSNETKSFEAGSLYKLWILLVAYDLIEKGQLTEDEQLSEDIAVLNDKFDIDKENAELTDGSITLSVKDAMHQMIVISHNYAALLLAERVKMSTVSDYLSNKGFKDSAVGQPPQATPLDIANLFERIYKGELVNLVNTQKILELLKKQELNDGLPKFLPAGVEVGHKTGDIGWFKHDGGIVFSPKGDYVIVVMSQSDSPLVAQEKIAEISRIAYEYFNK